MTSAAPSSAMTVHSRQLAICTFSSEKSTTPLKSGIAPWDVVVALHADRKLREGKSGRMIGGYAINGTRKDANVPCRSMIQLDIDTEGRKDKTSGRLLEVTRTAPTLDDIRAGIDRYEWVAASSHSHEPQRGVIKYRIVILPDRDILRDEWVPVLEALDELLQGVLDRGAWAWSQAFYLPSCPAENAGDAFYVHNEGQPLPVDAFVLRGRAIIAARLQKDPPSELRPPPPMPETRENIELIKSMLAAIDPDVHRPEWRRACWGAMATGLACAPQLIREWSIRGEFSENDFAKLVRDFDPSRGTSFDALVQIARKYGWTGTLPNLDDTGVTADDFYAYMPMHNYIFKPTGELWPATSVNARIAPVSVGDGKTVAASKWLDKNRSVEQMTWAPGEPQLIVDRLVSNGGSFVHAGANCFNLYRPPAPQPDGDRKKAARWVKHIQKLYPKDFVHIIYYSAHRVQRPQEKINHALVLGGSQGIGKDTILEPVKRAIGPWNFEEASPRQLLGRFNGFLKAVILRVSEARDLGDIDRFQFYDHMKTYTASPPDVLRIDEKHLREHYVSNCCAVIITTNHKTDGIYLPPDDRRHYVAWSDCTKEDFGEKYWTDLWSWYEREGYAHVAALLANLDISQFDPKAPPPKTPAFLDIVDANQAPEDAELADVIDKLGGPDAVTLSQIRAAAIANCDFYSWISDRKNRRAIPHRLEKCGYVSVRNNAATDGQWKINGSRVRVYAKSTLAIKDRLSAAAALTV